MHRIKISPATVLAVIGIVLALGGSAVAATKLAKDSVDSRSIRNETVRGFDIKDGTLTGSDVQDAGLSGSDLAGGSVTGDQVDESSLSDVGSAAQGGTGRYGFSGQCDPTSTQFVPCSVVNLSLDHPGRVLVNATAMVQANQGTGGQYGVGECRIGTTNGPIVASTSAVKIAPNDVSYVTLTGVTDVFPAGTHSVGIDCHETQPGYPVRFPHARVTAVALSAK